jgi:hypothetical protein
VATNVPIDRVTDRATDAGPVSPTGRFHCHLLTSNPRRSNPAGTGCSGVFMHACGLVVPLVYWDVHGLCPAPTLVGALVGNKSLLMRTKTPRFVSRGGRSSMTTRQSLSQPYPGALCHQLEAWALVISGNWPGRQVTFRGITAKKSFDGNEV